MAGRWRAQLLGDGRAGVSSGGRWPGGGELRWAMAGRGRAQVGDGRAGTSSAVGDGRAGASSVVGRWPGGGEL
eukprot:208678-Chlamydomonas_euryale.AAC.1